MFDNLQNHIDNIIARTPVSCNVSDGIEIYWDGYTTIESKVKTLQLINFYTEEEIFVLRLRAEIHSNIYHVRYLDDNNEMQYIRITQFTSSYNKLKTFIYFLEDTFGQPLYEFLPNE